MQKMIAAILLCLCAADLWSHEVINSAEAPRAVGPYSQAIQAGNTVYLAGQIALDPATGTYTPASIQDETRRVLNNLRAVLQAAGLDLAHLVSTTVYLADLDDFAAMNAAYAEFFTDAAPARATIEAARIPGGAKVEISAIAVR